MKFRLKPVPVTALEGAATDPRVVNVAAGHFEIFTIDEVPQLNKAVLPLDELTQT